MRSIYIFMLAAGATLLADDRIVLRSGETISASGYAIGPVEAVIGGRTVPRPSIDSLLAGENPPSQFKPLAGLDTVVLKTGERATGHVTFASPEKVQLDLKTIAAKDVAQILFATGEPGDWALEISTTGGFTGRGGPHQTETSYGYQNKSGKEAAMPPGVLKKVDAAVRSAKPAEWRPSYIPPSHACADCYQYTLTLDVVVPGGTWSVYRTTWFSGDEDRFPADLTALMSALAAGNGKARTPAPIHSPIPLK